MILLGSLLVNAQVDTMYKGIKFEDGLTWEQIREKALRDHKYIFMDCFTTWCGPCRNMERTTYSNEQVGAYVNSKFISVKVQMDTSTRDSDRVKKWYAQSQDIRQQYQIVNFPTYLFFSSNGTILHRDLGYKWVGEFIELLHNAISSDKQYYFLLEKYKCGSLPYVNMPYLAEMAKRLNEIDLANAVAKDYTIHYLLKMKSGDLYTKKNIEFLKSFLQHSSDKWFWLFYDHADKIDELMGQKDFSQGVVDNIISSEEIYSKLLKNNKPITDNPDWSKIEHEINSKYSETYSERTVLNAKIWWYTYKKEWDKAVKYNVLKIDRYGLDTAADGKYFLNNMIYNVIFMHGKDKIALNKAIEWMRLLMKVLPDNPYYIDTYANLLYKIGEAEQALKLELKAVELSPENSEIRENLYKIKRNEPTWTTN